MQKRLFILSTRAGDGRPLQYAQLIRSIYEEAGAADICDIKTTCCPEDTKNFTQSFAQELQETLSYPPVSSDKVHDFDYPCVYILGGDGSISEVCNALMKFEKRPAFGCIPAGTANDLVKSWGIFTGQDDRQRKEIARELIAKSLKPRFKPFDLIAFRSDDKNYPHAYSSNIISMGIDSQILRDAYRLLRYVPRYPSLAFNAAIAKTIGKLPVYQLHVQLTTSSKEVISYTNKVALSVISNGSYYGNGYHPAPHAKTDDGRIDLISAEKVSRINFIKLVKALKEGTHLKSKTFYHNADIIMGELHSLSGPVPANFDGRLLSFTQLEFEIVPHALLRSC